MNESVWEHQKLIYFPTLIYSIVEYFVSGRKIQGYISAVSAGIFAGIASMITIFYTYSGILGYSVTAIDIIIFFIGVLVMLWVKNLIIKRGCFRSTAANAIWGGALIILGILFVVWSFYTPSLGIFTPPVK